MRDPATIKQWLDAANFNWSEGRILHQPAEEGTSPGSSCPSGARFITFDDPILTTTFETGYGRASCPCFVAEDSDAIYFPSQYDGSTSLEKIFKNVEKYLDWQNNPTPYPGG